MRPAVAALGLALLMVAVAFALPSGTARAADLTGKYGGDLHMALLAAPSWNPLSTNPADANAHNLVWDTLARPDPTTGEPKPWAASGWTADKVPGTNNGTITVSIRPGLTWSDGTAITTADLRYTFGTRYGFAVSASGSDLVFTFTDPDGPSGPANGDAGRFYSEVLYDWIAWDSGGTVKYSGPFAPGGVTNVLNANTHYWAGRPYLDSVTIVIASSVDDAACRLLKNQNATAQGTVDFIGFPLFPTDLSDERACTAYGGFEYPPLSGNFINKSLVNPNGTRSEPHVSAVHHPGPRFLYYWVDVAGGGVMGDVNFRRALYLFVNKQLAGQIEPSSAVTHSLVSRENYFWFMPSWEVVRDAGFTTIRDPAGTPRQDTNPFAGAQALDMAGYLDRNGDGWRETPAGAAFTVNVGVVGFNVDPRKTTIVGAYADVLRRQGVDANVVTFASWTDLRAAEAAGSVDVAMETADTATANPRFMETFQPILDANDANTRTHLNLGKNAFTLAERALHFNHVTYYNSLCACVLPVLHYQTLEAYDRVSFEGWVDMFGGINNVWSFTGLMLPQLGRMKIAVSSFATSVASGGSTTIQVAVTDASGATPVAGATVALTASGGTLGALTGTTDANGRFSTSWTAPTVSEDRDVTVWATVSKPQYVGGTVSTALTVHPPFQRLDVTIVLGSSILGAGNSTSVTVTVTSGGQLVANANVTLSVSLIGGRLGAYTGNTNPSGVFTTTFTGTPNQRSIYRIDVAVSRAGYAPGSSTASAIVTAPPTEPEEYTQINLTQNVPGFEAVVVLAALGAAVAILRWRNRREG